MTGHEPDVGAARRGALRLPLSPVADDRVRRLAVGSVAVAGLALALLASAPYAAQLAAVGALALVFGWGWPVLGGSHTPDQAAVVLVVAAVGIVATSVREDLSWIAGAVALGIVMSFFQQLVRGVDRTGLVLSLLAAAGGLAVLASGALLAALGHRPEARGIVVVAMVAVVASLVGDLLLPVPGLRPFLGLVVLVFAVLVALLVRVWLDGVSISQAFGVAAAAATLSWSCRRVVALQPAILTHRGQLAAGIGSVLLVGAVAHLFTVLA